MPRRNRNARSVRGRGNQWVDHWLLDWIERHPTPYSARLDAQGIKRLAPRTQSSQRKQVRR